MIRYVFRRQIIWKAIIFILLIIWIATIYNIGIRPIFLESYFLETIFAILNYTYRVFLYVKLYEKVLFSGLAFIWIGGGVFKRFSHFFQPWKITVYLLMRSAFT